MKTLASLLLAAAVAVAGLAGCKTESFCFANCDGSQAGGGGGGGVDGGGMGGGFAGVDGCVGFNCGRDDAGGDGNDCIQTNAGVEICDDIDNDCDGEIDEAADIDFTLPENCGNCDLDCTQELTRVVTELCNTDNIELGRDPGQCRYDECRPNFFDANNMATDGCEYYCPWNPDRTVMVDLGGADGCGKDDDCDLEIDEDVDVCDDLDNCGECGRLCVLPHATPDCVTTAADPADCDVAGATTCEIARDPTTNQKLCDAGWVDENGDPRDGCEYQCTPSNGGVEICDSVDNDCDRAIDNTDDGLLASDPRVGQSCQGGTQGICADPANAGVTKCINGVIDCCDVSSNSKTPLSTNHGTGLRNEQCIGDTAPFVIEPGEVAEACDAVDNDCDGALNEAGTAGTNAICGTSIGECETGLTQCVQQDPTNPSSPYVIRCLGETAGTAEVCNGRDDDCDGVIDATRDATTPVTCTTSANCAANAPYLSCVPVGGGVNECVRASADSVNPTTGAAIQCTEYTPGTVVAATVPPPPAGATSPCVTGTAACTGGVLVCQNFVGPTSATDACGVDSNCNGILENQTGLGNNDPLNCGSCGNDCNALGGNVNWQCSSGTCAPAGCKTGFYECNPVPSANDCETACTVTSNIELCDNIDNDCNCQVDDNPPEPTVVAACGVNVAATDPGCTSLVTKQCVNANWQCTFPAGYCAGGSCSADDEICDNSDNDCDGLTNENFLPPILNTGFLGAACNSDDGLPAPGHGPCRTSGVFVCKADGTGTQCSAQINPALAQTEICNGVDDDCDGLVDAADSNMNDPAIGATCQGGNQGVCADPSNAGTTACVNGGIACSGPNVVVPFQLDETCNSLDDDCDGQTDEIGDLIDDGNPCGSSVGGCVPGVELCTFNPTLGQNTLQCQGAITAQPEVCNSVDDNCDGLVDNAMTDVSQPCNVPPPPPAGATSPCQAGTTACVLNTATNENELVCQGSITAPAVRDNCGEDTNCSGTLTNQPDFQNDNQNCGACGNDCTALNSTTNGVWTCVSGGCQRTACADGFINCDGNPDNCEIACVLRGAESCNNVDDDCDCTVDNVAAANIPAPFQVCGTSEFASDPSCLEFNAASNPSGVVIQCTAGNWACTFATGYCNEGTPASCAATDELCDNKDNNCNGGFDEDFKAPQSTKPLAATCTSENVYVELQCATSGNPACPPPPPHGACSGDGTYICAPSQEDTVCTATFDGGAAGPELCDTEDNDCDGIADETFNNPGTNATFFVQPAVVQIGASLWMYQYEASRPDATAGSPGTGNGYWCTGSGCTGDLAGVTPAPSNVVLDMTGSCSESGTIPWSNVTPIEVEQVCAAMGGFICDLSDWQTACEAQNNCGWAYAPRASCSTPGQGICNLDAFDFGGAAGDQDGLLPTASNLLTNCYADWAGLLAGGQIFDLTGNLWEITQRDSTTYTLMGGSYTTQSEDGARCDFDFFSVDNDFKLFDAGFRCCFDQDPR